MVFCRKRVAPYRRVLFGICLSKMNALYENAIRFQNILFIKKFLRYFLVYFQMMGTQFLFRIAKSQMGNDQM